MLFSGLLSSSSSSFNITNHHEIVFCIVCVSAGEEARLHYRANKEEMSAEDSDAMFTAIAERLGGVKPLLDAFFGFLNRRTDFYVEFDPAKDAQAKVGFPKGLSKKLVLDAFSAYPLKEYDAAAYGGGSSSSGGGGGSGVKAAATSSSSSSSTPSRAPQNNKATSSSSTSSHNSNSSSSTSTTSSSSSSSNSSDKTVVAPRVRLTEEGKQVPVGNGGFASNYYWTQTLKDVTVYIDVPIGTRGKDVTCKISAKKLFLVVSNKCTASSSSSSSSAAVTAAGDDAGALIDGELEGAVRVDESMWTLSITQQTEEPQVVITLDKVVKTWWKHVIVGHAEIDTSKVDSTQRMEEYDESTQAAIRKIMFEERQKQRAMQELGVGGMGLSEEEVRIEELLAKHPLPSSPSLSPSSSSSAADAADASGND